MRDEDLYEKNLIKARGRSARRRTLDLLECVPSTHDVDRGIVIEIQDWLAERGIQSANDLIDPKTRQPRDVVALAFVEGVFKAVSKMGFDVRNQRTQNRIAVRLGIAEPMQPRPRHDEFTR